MIKQNSQHIHHPELLYHKKNKLSLQTVSHCKETGHFNELENLFASECVTQAGVLTMKSCAEVNLSSSFEGGLQCHVHH